MNVPLLQEIKATILAEPKTFRMDTYSCGTAHCIAGHALLKHGLMIEKPAAGAPRQRLTDNRDPWDAARELLGIREGEANRLFVTDFWPEDLYDRYLESTDRDHRAAVAAERIDRFIQSGGAE